MQEENKEEINENVNNEEANDTAQEAIPENEEVVDQEEMEEELTEDDKLAAMNEKYVRLYSDFDNYRKRTIREKADIISSASGEVIKDLLGLLDDFERAIANNEKVDDPDSLKEGFKLIQSKLANTLSAKGLEPMEAKEKVFDPEIHEAITNIPAPSEELKGKVVDVIEKGYTLKGKILRYAKVVVGQ